MIQLLLLFFCFTFSNAAQKKSIHIKRMNTRTLKTTICVTASTKSNTKTNETSIKFTMLPTSNAIEAQKRAGRETAKRKGRSRLEGGPRLRTCQPQSRCGLLFFPSTSEDLLNYFLNSEVSDTMQLDRQLNVAYGSRGRLAAAIVSKSVKGHRKRSKHLPSAYILRKVINKRPLAGEILSEKRKDHIRTEHGIQPVLKNPKKNMLDPQELFEQIVIPLVALDRSDGSENGQTALIDQLEVMLSEINNVCSTRYRTERQRLSVELLRELYIDQYEEEADENEDENSEGLARIEASEVSELDSNEMAMEIPISDSDTKRVYNHKYALELIAKGASVNVRSRLGETPLIYAADEGNYIVVNRIMMLGGILNLKDSQDRTALHLACSNTMNMDLRIVQDLAVGCKINYPDKKPKQKDFQTERTTAESSTENDAANNVFTPAPSFVPLSTSNLESCLHIRDTSGRTPFATALDQLAKIFYYERAQPNDFVIAASMLLETGSDINAPNYVLQTPLMLASQRKLYHAVDFLLENKANVELKDLNGCTALCHAIEWYSWSVTLASKVTNIVPVNRDQIGTEIHSLLQLHSFDAIEDQCQSELLKQIYNIQDSNILLDGTIKKKNKKNKKNKIKLTKNIKVQDITNALLNCTFLDRTVELLIQKGQASFNVIDSNGNTPMHYLHPKMNFNSILNKKQKKEIKQLSKVQNNNGMLWQEEIQWINKDYTKRKQDQKEIVIDSTGSSNSLENDENDENGDGCDFDQISWEELVKSKSDTLLTYFEKNFVTHNKPLLITNFTSSSSVKWLQLKKTWSNEDWINKMYGREMITAGVIPYPSKFQMKTIHRTIQTYLIQIEQEEKKRKKYFNAQKKKLNNQDTNNDDESKYVLSYEEKHDILRNMSTLSKSSSPPIYLFHLVDINNPKESFDMGSTLVKYLGNFTPTLVSNMYQRTAQFYYGRYGSGAPFHFHGDALNVLISGKKEWLLTAPKHAVYSKIHPSLWKNNFKELSLKGTGEGKKKKYYRCTQIENSLIYVPKGWSHAVLNIDEKKPTVGVAVEFARVRQSVKDRLLEKIQSTTESANNIEKISVN